MKYAHIRFIQGYDYCKLHDLFIFYTLHPDINPCKKWNHKKDIAKKEEMSLPVPEWYHLKLHYFALLHFNASITQ